MIMETVTTTTIITTITYGDISKKLSVENGLKSMSAQAVDGAVGHNPI